MDRLGIWWTEQWGGGGFGVPGAQGGGSEWGWHPMWGLLGMWGAWGIAMLLAVFLFWVLVFVGFVLGIRWLVLQGKASRPDAALDVLRQRYARGEIGKEEFEAKKRDLGG